MIKLSIFLFAIQITTAMGSELCSQDLNGIFPSVDSSTENILNNLTNRDFDPCQEVVKPSLSKKELCSRDARYFQNLLCMKQGKMGFKNQKGLFGLPTGVCWWHSQFHRNATYTTHYAPNEPKLDPDNANDKKKLDEIINNIVRLKNISKIPGYSSIREFTEDPKIEKLVQKKLQKWMTKDSFLKMQWMNGLTIPKNYSTKSKEFFMGQKGWKYNPHVDLGSEKLNAKAQRIYQRKTYKTQEREEKAKEKTIEHQSKEIDELFTSVSKNNQIGFITLQYTGVMAHSQIVLDAKKTIKGGETVYDFKVQDSNYQGKGSEFSPFSPRAYSQMRYKDGVWYAKSQKGVINATSDYYEPVNIKVNHSNQLNKVDKIFQEQCSKSLFH